MELKVSSLKREGLSPADCVSDPEEKEVSDEDDDDRNHKHRRRETRSQSSERESLEPVFSRSYRKHTKPFENGDPFRQNESAASESWKNYNNAPLERDFHTKLDKRRPGLMPLSRVPMDMNQRMRPNQYFPGELGPGRGRGRDPGSWSQRDSRFSPIDLASQIVQQGPIASSLFPGRGLANVSNPQGASWNGFGLIPGIPNGGLDTLHPIALPGTLRPSLNSSLNMGIPRQRCRDFEERGFCLRGDMCPMEHGVNRIVVEDVQSLSQFNLPVSLPNSQLAGTVAGPGGLPSVGAPSCTLMNSKPTQGRSSKSGMADDSLGLNGDYPSMSGADLYDPDQPLWNNSGPETSSGILPLHSPKNDETESLMGVDPSDHVGSQGTSSSVWGRICTSKKKSKEKNDLAVSTSDYLENESKDHQDALTNVQGTSRQGKRIITGDVGLRHVDSSTKTQIDSTRNSVRKPSQKALRTLFVNSIPLKSNKREALLSHFQKFGEVMDIYIPLNSERAFVQFSKREEAEAALRAPDAVMGNRFIKLWWANRDSIPDDGMSTSINASVTSRGGTAASGLAHPSAGNSGNENLQAVSSKGAMSAPHDSSVTAPDNQRLILANGPKVPPPSQKKLESLEQLKEDIRKKQELLDQKRNDFRRKLDKLAKQATGVKGEAVTEPSGKRQKVGTLADVTKPSAPSSSDPTAAVAHLHADISVDKNNVVENVVSASPKTATSQQDPTISKQSIRPLGPVGPSIPMNRYKLDNRPRSFRIITPLPAGLRNVTALKDYFSSYGEIPAVELEGGEPHSDNDNADESEGPENCLARLTFTTRQSAEKAFLNGKNWQGNSLKFTWVTSSTSIDDTGEKKNSSVPKDAVDADIQPVEGLTWLDSVEVSVSGSGEHENSGQDGGVDNMEMVEVSQPCKALISGERESPKKELCPSPEQGHSPTSISGGEESIQQGSDPTATSEQKQSPNGVLC